MNTKHYLKLNKRSKNEYKFDVDDLASHLHSAGLISKRCYDYSIRPDSIVKEKMDIIFNSLARKTREEKAFYHELMKFLASNPQYSELTEWIDHIYTTKGNNNTVETLIKPCTSLK